MGHSLEKLSKRDISTKSIFNNRFVVEVCEKIHVHYRNLRLILSLSDFLELAQGFVSTLTRWGNMGQPEPSPGQHIELCRRKVASDTYNENIQVNLNKNLYNHNKGIYSEGVDFEEKQYIHIKIRDIRLEFSLKEFEELSDVIVEAKERLKDSNISSGVLQT